MITEDKKSELIEIAKENDGHCDRCNQIIKFYRYPVNQQMVKVLRAMRQAVEDSGENKVNFNDVDLPYRLESQRTKMRFHGLIAKYKLDGTHVPNTWLITKKGGDFLKGAIIPKYVVVYDNQLLGHEGDLVSIYAVMGDVEVGKKPISPAEAKAYSGIRQAKKNMKVTVNYLGPNTLHLTRGDEYQLEIDELKMGEPVRIINPIRLEYPDIASFSRHWKVIG